MELRKGNIILLTNLNFEINLPMNLLFCDRKRKPRQTTTRKERKKNTEEATEVTSNQTPTRIRSDVLASLANSPGPVTRR